MTDDDAGGGGKNGDFLDDVICERPLIINNDPIIQLKN